MDLDSNVVLCAAANIMTVISGNRVLYYSPEKDDILYANIDVNRVLMYCNMGITYETLILRINRLDGVSKTDARKLTNDLIRVGLLYVDGISESLGNGSTFEIEHIYDNFKKEIPRLVSIHLGYECNLSCVYCYNGIIRGKENQKTPLHSSKWRDILSQLDKYGIRKIAVTGGEPMLYKDSFSEIFSEWKAKGNSIDLITNGTMIEECDMETLKSIYNSITISIDSHLEDVANSLRGDVFSRVHNTILLFNRNDIKWSVNSVLTSININEYMNTRAYYKSKGAQAVAPTIVDSVALSDISLVPSLVQVESYYDKANHQKREAIDCGIMNTPINLNYGCSAGIGELAIAPDGGVYPCRMLMSKEWRCGDLVKQTFEDIWKNSETLVSMRRYLSNIGSVCSGCRVQRYCKGGCIAHSNSSPHNYISGEGGYFCHLTKYEIPMDMELNCYIREMKMNADVIKDMV